MPIDPAGLLPGSLTPTWTAPSLIIDHYAEVTHQPRQARFVWKSAGWLHFASAMALTRHQDGNDASTGASYLEIACVLIDHVANTINDCGSYVLASFVPCWSSATDDHLRNHSFILVPGKGWHLSDVHDMNPAPGSQGLKDVQNAFTNCSRR